jgi:nucleoside diphosphate kinase
MVGSLIQIAHDFHLNLGRVETSSKGEVLLEFLCFNRSVSESYPKASSSIATSTITSFEEISETFNRVKSIRVSEPCTLCIIKPHVLKANQSGTLINTIVENGFKISGIVSVHLSPRMTEELFDVYRNIYRPYSGMVQHYCSAPVLALMITGDTCDIVAQFRELSGPLNPDIALSLR